MKNVHIDEPTSFLDHVYLGCTRRECKPNETIIQRFSRMFNSRIIAGATEKVSGWGKVHAQTVACPTTWKDVPKNALNDTVTLQIRKWEQLKKVSHPCLDDHQFKKEELESVAELSEVCSQIVLKCLYEARIGRPDIL